MAFRGALFAFACWFSSAAQGGAALDRILRTSRGVGLQLEAPRRPEGAATTGCHRGDASATPAPEVGALVDLFWSTNGPGWLNASGWSSIQLEDDTAALQPCGPPRPWHGLECNCTLFASHVTSIELQENGLDGSLPPSLGQLSFLETLDLAANALLAGTIPAGICDLAALKSLILKDTALSGTIPTCLGQCSMLKEIQLSSDKPSGVPYGNLTLSGTIPDSLCNLRNLERFLLQFTQDLRGPIPSCLGINQPRLYALAIQGNQLTGEIPPSLCSIGPALKYLLLNDNSLDGTAPPCIGSLSSIIWLDVAGNSLRGSIHDSLCGLTGVEHLMLAANQLTGTLRYD